VSTIEELFGSKSSGSGLESREYGRRDPSRWPRGTTYPWKLALTSPTNGGHYISLARSRTQATVFFVRKYYNSEALHPQHVFITYSTLRTTVVESV
jgi:hypothetical protein